MAKVSKSLSWNDPFTMRLRALIKEKGIAFDELAEEVGTTRQTVSNWQNGSTTPEIISLRKMAKFFDVTSDYLIGTSDVRTYDVSIRVASEVTGLSEEQIGILKSMDKDDVNKLFKMVSFYNTIK